MSRSHRDPPQSTTTPANNGATHGPHRRKPLSRHEEPWDIEHTHPEPKGTLPMLIMLILISVGLAAIAQITLKAGMNAVRDELGHAFRADGASLRTAATTPAVWIGLALFGLSAVVWLSVLSRSALSFAYPFAALTYVVIVVYDTIHKEPVGPLRWGGVGLIVLGIILVSRTPPHG
jgi:drug/metabolite transporter (DMT)-like permease